MSSHYHLKYDTTDNTLHQPLFQQFNQSKHCLELPKNELKKNQFILGRKLLADLSGLPFNRLLSNELFAFNSLGKPTLKKSNAFFFSIAHSDKHVVVATSQSNIGADIEQYKLINPKRFHRAFSTKEWDYLMSLDEAKQAYTALKLWTIKEAVLKAIGVGLPGNPKSVEIDLVTFKSAKRYDQQFTLFDHSTTDYLLSVALETNQTKDTYD
ncbi:4'-phosphopantetheinyl transferase superfamily protein [Holzapfeliella sp. He02]|uniref:4'-phosphopantetheinyl transferase superfamily protein n=1 Tax=Holzapfeliella saturejae TaxID=3082953 RepID=A0ABU8SJ32_9LACO